MKNINPVEFLFCNDPFDDKKVDPDFEDEYTAAKENGFGVHLFSFEKITSDNDPIAATVKVKPAGNSQTLIYRGWMLKPAQYALLYQVLQKKNYELINTPVEYQLCHYFPDSYPFIKAITPRTVWIRLHHHQVDYDKIFGEIAQFGNAPIIIKDFVKSQKHYWDTACFIPSAADKEKVRSVIGRFLELQGPDLNEGIVIRQFVELDHLADHSKSGMPLKQEYRLFFLNGHLLDCYDYWEEGEYASHDKPPLHLFSPVAGRIGSHFFSMDIAKTREGNWIVIELGDGQVAGLPDKANRMEFYQHVRKAPAL